MINQENLIKIGRAGGNTSNRETPDQIGRVGMSANGCSLGLCIPFLKLTNKEQASIFWSLAANVTRNMIGKLLTSTCMLLVLSNKGKGIQSSSEQQLVGRIVA